MKIIPISLTLSEFMKLINYSRYASDKLINERLYDFIKLYIKNNILDLGCGRQNYLLENNTINDGRIIGVDQNFDSIKSNKIIHFGILADIECLPFKENTIDCALMLDVAEHLSNPLLCLLQIHQCLKPGANLIVCTPNLYGFSGISIIGKFLPLKFRYLLLRLLDLQPLSSPFPLYYRINSIKSAKKMASKSFYVFEKVFLLPITPHWITRNKYLHLLHFSISRLIYKMPLFYNFVEKFCFVFRKEEYSEKILNCIIKLNKYFETTDYKGYDPYDALSSNFLNFFTFNTKPLRLAIQQFMRRSFINFRPLFGVKKGINSKGMGLIAFGYLNMYERTGDAQYLEKAKGVLQWLIDNYSQGFSGYCWGYNFDWQSRAFFLPKGTPTVVNTSFIGRAFIKAYDLIGEKKYLDIARSSCDFILKDLNRLEEDNCLCFSYSPLDRYFVHNANVLGASLLALVYERTEERNLLNVAKKAMNYTAMHQNPDGSWFYGEDKTARKTGIDNFHTGFVLESFKIYARATGDRSFDDNIRKGLEFYQKNFFLSDGVPKYFHNKIYPLDINSASQAIITLIQLKDYGADLELCKKIVEWMIKNMWDEKKGYFYYQKGRFITNKIPYIRWSQAWAFKALSYYE